MQTPFDTPLELVQPDTTKIFAAPFWFPWKFQKRHSFFIEFSENYHMWISRNFCGVAAIKFRLFLFSKRALTFQHPFPAVLLFQGGRLFLFSKHTIPRLKKGAGGMEVKIEESEQSKYQAKQNQTGIPFPYRTSRTDWKAHLYSLPAVRGVPLSRAWLSVPGRGRRMYAHKIDEAIWEDRKSVV